MNPEQQAAYVIAQSACLMAEIAGMQAENQFRAAQGETLAYGEQAFQDAVVRSGCHHNAVISLFTGR